MVRAVCMEWGERQPDLAWAPAMNFLGAKGGRTPPWLGGRDNAPSSPLTTTPATARGTGGHGAQVVEPRAPSSGIVRGRWRAAR